MNGDDCSNAYCGFLMAIDLAMRSTCAQPHVLERTLESLCREHVIRKVVCVLQSAGPESREPVLEGMYELAASGAAGADSLRVTRSLLSLCDVRLAPGERLAFQTLLELLERGIETRSIGA